MAEKKISPRTQRNTDANERRHQANVVRVSALNLPEAVSEHIKLRRDSKGKTYEVLVTRRVSPSKMLRTADRQRARMIAGRAAVAAADAEDKAIAAELAAHIV